MSSVFFFLPMQQSRSQSLCNAVVSKWCSGLFHISLGSLWTCVSLASHEYNIFSCLHEPSLIYFFEMFIRSVFFVQANLWHWIIYIGGFSTVVYDLISNSAELFLYKIISLFIKYLLEPPFTWNHTKQTSQCGDVWPIAHIIWSLCAMRIR